MAQQEKQKAVRFAQQELTQSEKQANLDQLAAARGVLFKSQHFLLVLFFLWLTFLHFVGIFFFTKGFLLTRLVLDDQSSCSEPSISTPSHGPCWLPPTFDKAVVILIDALRYDFTVPRKEEQHYFNALTVLHETSVASPHNAFLLPFIADPPTTTLQRLKGLTTGTLPTFIDAGANFGGFEIEEDNLLGQLRVANKSIVHLGDDTWHALFPGYFDEEHTRPYDSLNVWDLHTVDNGVEKHLLPLLKRPHKWDVVIGHFLGVDHAGHRYGPDHPAMNAKLKQMDLLLRTVIADLPDDTLLVVMGDHGMDAKGDHGGESDDEVEAALWMYSKKPVFGRSKPEFKQPPETAKERPVPQIDLVPTLALLMGLPIPFNNLGAPIEEAFIGKDGKQWQNLASARALAGAQIRRYQEAYAVARGLDAATVSETSRLWDTAKESWKQTTASGKGWQEAASKLSAYQRANLQLCKSLWAQFKIPSMIVGGGVLAAALFVLLGFAVALPGDKAAAVPGIVRNALIGLVIGGIASAGVSMGSADSDLTDFLLLGGAAGSLLGFTAAFVPFFSQLRRLLPSSIWGWTAVIFTVLPSIGFASNSFTIWEDEIMLFFLATFGLLSAVSSFRQVDEKDRLLGIYHSVMFLILTRAASLSRLCREEQMPYCRSTYYASASSSTSAPWQLLIPYLIAMALPSILKSFYAGTKSYEGSAQLTIGVGFRMGLLLSAVYWTLDAADNAGWLAKILSEDSVGRAKILVAQIVLALAFAAGIATFIWAPPCIRIETREKGSAETPNKPALVIFGYSNAHGSRYGLLVVAFALGAVLVQKPMGGGATALMTWQIFALAEILDANGLTPSAILTTTASGQQQPGWRGVSSIGPVVLALLASFYYFKTGHQATLSSIQWDSAFLALRTLRYPWSPLLVALNTFGAHALAAAAVPLLALWKRPPRAPALLSDVAGAVGAHLAFYAVVSLATTAWAGHLRRHLMLYRIFCPRFLVGAVVLLVVDAVAVLVGVVGVRANTSGVADVFGWG